MDLKEILNDLFGNDSSLPAIKVIIDEVLNLIPELFKDKMEAVETWVVNQQIKAFRSYIHAGLTGDQAILLLLQSKELRNRWIGTILKGTSDGLSSLKAQQEIKE